MTTTISRHDMQLQQLQLQQQQQQQLFQQQQQQQQQQQLLHQQQQRQQQQQQQQQLYQQHSATFLLRNSNLLAYNDMTPTTNLIISTPYDNSALLTPILATTGTATANTSTTAAATTCLDSATTIIQIDSINNNTNNTTGLTQYATTPTGIQSGLNTINNNGGGGGGGGGSGAGNSPDAEQPTKTQKRRSLLSFKSLDFHIKSLYSGLRNGNKNAQSQASNIGGGSGGGVDGAGNGGNANGSSVFIADTPSNARAPALNNRMPPYLKIESVDAEEAENLLLDYPQSPYSSRRNSSHDDNRSSSQLMHINRYDMSRSPSPYFLSPYGMSSGNIRRSSTSDIVSCKRSGTSSASDSRRPSTTDLLRRARERRGTEARMGRSVSHGGLPRGGLGMGGRRKSMAF